MIDDNDKQIILDAAGTIESGLMRIADAIPDNGGYVDTELCEAIRFAGERVEQGCVHISNSLDRLARCFEKE